MTESDREGLEGGRLGEDRVNDVTSSSCEGSTVECCVYFSLAPCARNPRSNSPPHSRLPRSTPLSHSVLLNIYAISFSPSFPLLHYLYVNFFVRLSPYSSVCLPPCLYLYVSLYISIVRQCEREWKRKCKRSNLFRKFSSANSL